MICPVVVAHNSLKPFTHAFWPLGVLRGCDPNAVVNGFFVCAMTSVLHTIASVQPDGVEGKGTRYVERLGGSSRIVRATGRIIKSRGVAFASMMILFTGVKYLPSLLSSLGVGGVFG